MHSEMIFDPDAKQLVYLRHAYKLHRGKKRENFFVAARNLEFIFKFSEVSCFRAQCQSCFGLAGLSALRFGASRSLRLRACYPLC